MALEIVQIPARRDNYIYLLHDAASHKTAVVDPADAPPVEAALHHRGWTLDFILNTHHHNDHIGGNLALKQDYGCKIYGYGPDAVRIPGIDHLLEDDELVEIGEAKAQVIYIPGHTLGHIAYYFPADKALFCGDTLFSLGCGRLFEGTPQQMYDSLQKLAALPDDTLVFCAHEYTQSNGAFALTLEPHNAELCKRMAEVEALRMRGRSTVPSTLGQEKATNPFLREDSAEIRQSLGMQHASSLAVFTEIRHRKDIF